METIGRNLLRDAAYERLLGAIVDGSLAPGAALRADELAARLGLSRAPIREAIARLTAEGLVETKPQSYTRVTQVDPKETADAAAVLGAMHDLAVRAVAATLDAARLDRMRAANARFAEAVRAGDLDAALAADDEVHAVPIAAYGNVAAARTVERYTPMVRRAERVLFGSPGGQRSIQLHDDLIAALARHDQAAAVAVNTTIWGHLHHSHL